MSQKHRMSPVPETFGCSALGRTSQAFPAAISPSRTRRLSSVCMQPLLLVDLCVICLHSSPSPASSSFLPSSSSSSSISYPVTKGPSEGIQEEVREPWLLFGLNFRTESHIVLEFLNLEGQMTFNMVTGNFVVHF